ncbi:type II toxin-antitoxin system Phd/YefM family antitoxin [Paraburkholderia elongata]|uniref:Prevent-host-death protein n=1 Tax=Paraburkholderia elongata TaxID=2675747 RepID=A0A972NUM0_9BURK|nr:prevent-host-death protein [Paraburkholderia elongata]NPT58127.1 prevent-host-death protein [Paraburkholderia elongata]
MTVVDITEATQSLPTPIAALGRGETREIVITRGGQPVARLVPVKPTRIGIAKGQFEVPDSTVACDDEVTRLLRGEGPL